MIVEGLLTVIQNLLELLLGPIDIPDLPESLGSVIDTAIDYMLDGLSIFAAFTHYQFIMALLAATITIEAAMLLYKFILWILKKIPASSIE